MRLIDADALKDKLQKGQAAAIADNNFEAADHLGLFIATIDFCPTVEVESGMIDREDVPRGRWYDHMHTDTAVCSECGRVFTDETPYCPNCGAYMREDEGADNG